MAQIHFTFSDSPDAGYIEIVPNHGRVAVYVVERETGYFRVEGDSTIRKRDLDGKSYEVGTASVKNGYVTCNGQSITMRPRGMFTNSEIFTGTNGTPYKWKVESLKNANLRVNDSSKRTLATYTTELGFFAKKRASVVVYEDGLEMLDEVIATCVYMAHRIAIQQNA